MTKNTNNPSDAPFDISGSLLDRLARTMTKADLTEIEFVDGERAIRLTRAPAPVVAATAPMTAVPAPVAAAAPVAATSAPAAPAASAAEIVATSATEESGTPVKSPMVGTAYLSPEPGKPSFVSVGDKVSKGQTLMIIEAMKVMNPLTSPADGVIKKVMVGDGEPVEFDQAVVVLA